MQLFWLLREGGTCSLPLVTSTTVFDGSVSLGDASAANVDRAWAVEDPLKDMTFIIGLARLFNEKITER